MISTPICSPLNYTGGKQKYLPQILPLFPKKINTFIDLFAGGCNIALNVSSKKIYCNDNLIYLIELYEIFRVMNAREILKYIEEQIKYFNLSLTNKEGFNQLRSKYNDQKNPLDLFVLVAFSFNHQIRFNNSHEFNTPFGYQRSSFNSTMKRKLVTFIDKIQQSNITFSSFNFESFDFSNLGEDDLVYCDPPYLITTATYNDGKRGFTGWDTKQEEKLLMILDNLHQKKIRFALSNVLEHKGKLNTVLVNWIDKNTDLTVSEITSDYTNSNYQTLVRDRKASREVLITNYKPEKTRSIFDL